MAWYLVIGASVVTIAANLISIRYSRITTCHSKATEWYSTHRTTDPKPDYVLKSERLRAK